MSADATCRHHVGRAEEIPPGAARMLPIGDWGVGVFNVDGRFHALLNRCPHMGAPVCKGVVTGTMISDAVHSASWVRDGEILRCPWHAWEFEIATGETIMKPVRKIRKLPVEVDEQGDVWLLHDAKRDACDHAQAEEPGGRPLVRRPT